MTLIRVQVQGTDECSLVFTERNFVALWFAMRISPLTNEACEGQIDSRLIMSRLLSISVEDVIMKRQRQEFGGQVPQVLRRNKVEFFLFSLEQLCALAEQREDPVIWYVKETHNES